MKLVKLHQQEAYIFYKEKIRSIFFVTSLLFVLALLIVELVLSTNPGLATRLLIELRNVFNAKQIVNVYGNISAFSLIGNNLVATFSSLVLGIIPFVFIPAFTAILNGGVIGVLFGSISITTTSIPFLLAGLLPHGIFEIPAMILSVSLGIYICKETTLFILGKQKHFKLKSLAFNILRIYGFIIVPLLIIAGLIEAYITPVILNLF
ncbi:MAG: stage II sporulation protein M [Longicatena sp.]